MWLWAVCDPKAFQQKGEAIKDEMDQAYAGNMSTDDFKMFLGYYNRLESLINKYAAEVLSLDIPGQSARLQRHTGSLAE